MAKEAAATNERKERKPDDSDTKGAGMGWDEQRREDERKDRERLKADRAYLTPEKSSELQTELAALNVQYEADILKIREEYSAKKAELEQQIAAGSIGYGIVPSGPQPTNETLADGSSRRSVTIPVTA
jgi:hypothetical protein